MAQNNDPTKHSYYLDSRKFVRDLVHGYVHLTSFDLDLIDTPEFQRLKDIRQLTSQHVYPSARHTRFEHSLGVMELTRHAVRKLNRNGIISRDGLQPPDGGKPREPILDEQLQFNVALAALLHDIGHCPFSHMGETEFDKEEVLTRLCDNICGCDELKNTGLGKEAQRGSLPGAVHEQLSCIVILEKLYKKLASVNVPAADGKPALSVDFELIIRCIIGLPFDIKNTTDEDIKKSQQKNVAIQFINSSILDMDKLDYVMRDTLFTGIENPGIDTRRLFRNMYLNNEVDYTLAFSYRAVPALQNMIEARDNLYMYVYNHHAAVFSEFLYSYIFRRLEHNYQEFLQLAMASTPFKKIRRRGERIRYPNRYAVPVEALGIVRKSYLFSVDSVIKHYHSDSDLISLLNNIYCALKQYSFSSDPSEPTPALENAIREHICRLHEKFGNASYPKPPADGVRHLCINIKRVYTLIEQYTSRTFLKPWWKTNFEFSDFIERNFRDTRVRKTLCTWICNKSDKKPAGDEVRSQLAKHVIYIVQEIHKKEAWRERLGLLENLNDGGFFVIERAPRFYEPEKIQKLDIVLKNNAILSGHRIAKTQTSEYYINELTQVIPQRDYYAMYPKEGFYVFSKPLSPETLKSTLEETDQNNIKQNRHYRLIERIFVFVADWMVRLGEREFQRRFAEPAISERKEAEQKSKDEAFTEFLSANALKK